jgi:hypothetical protein
MTFGFQSGLDDGVGDYMPSEIPKTEDDDRIITIDLTNEIGIINWHNLIAGLKNLITFINSHTDLFIILYSEYKKMRLVIRSK